MPTRKTCLVLLLSLLAPGCCGKVNDEDFKRVRANLATLEQKAPAPHKERLKKENADLDARFTKLPSGGPRQKAVEALEREASALYDKEKPVVGAALYQAIEPQVKAQGLEGEWWDSTSASFTLDPKGNASFVMFSAKKQAGPPRADGTLSRVDGNKLCFFSGAAEDECFDYQAPSGPAGARTMKLKDWTLTRKK